MASGTEPLAGNVADTVADTGNKKKKATNETKFLTR